MVKPGGKSHPYAAGKFAKCLSLNKTPAYSRLWHTLQAHEYYCHLCALK